MQFLGLEPLPILSPNAEVRHQGRVYDLHSDASLGSVEYDYQTRVLRLRWTVRKAAWRTPTSGVRPIEAGLLLIIQGVYSIACNGVLSTPPGTESLELDFIEYQPLAGDLGELRFVLDNEASLVVTGSRCELRRVEAE